MSNNFNFAGTFGHGSTKAQAPNPCISVEGVGLIGLPLTESYARLIIGAARQAPFGQANETVVDKNVRNTWEIQPEQLSFMNPEWQAFVDETALALCKDLGAKVGEGALRCDLHKLLLYEPGSQ